MLEAYCTTASGGWLRKWPTWPSGRNGRMVEWSNGRMVEWSNGRMVEMAEMVEMVEMDAAWVLGAGCWAVIKSWTETAHRRTAVLLSAKQSSSTSIQLRLYLHLQFQNVFPPRNVARIREQRLPAS
jgi:hypothetical protein